MSFPERNHVLEETKNVRVRTQLAPVQPSGFVILVIGIVVAKLRIQEFISGSEHWSSVREKQQTAEILDMLSAQCQYVRCRYLVLLVAAGPILVCVQALFINVANL